MSLDAGGDGEKTSYCMKATLQKSGTERMPLSDMRKSAPLLLKLPLSEEDSPRELVKEVKTGALPATT